MEPGPELNAWLATHVMGWSLGWGGSTWIDGSGKTMHLVSFWTPSISTALAMDDIVSVVTEYTGRRLMLRQRVDFRWEACFVDFHFTVNDPMDYLITAHHVEKAAAVSLAAKMAWDRYDKGE